MYLQHFRLFKISKTTIRWHYFGMEKCKCRGAAGVYFLVMFFVFCHCHPCRPSELVLLLIDTIAATLLSFFEVDISGEEAKKPRSPNECNNPTSHNETSVQP
jgi:hypothetical protein